MKSVKYRIVTILQLHLSQALNCTALFARSIGVDIHMQSKWIRDNRLTDRVSCNEYQSSLYIVRIHTYTITHSKTCSHIF